MVRVHYGGVIEGKHIGEREEKIGQETASLSGFQKAMLRSVQKVSLTASEFQF